MSQEETLLEFPCRYPIKVMGRADSGFEQEVAERISRHADISMDEDVAVAHSRAGNFVSVTVTLTATSKQQLDTIYQELTAWSKVLMAL